MPSPKDGKAGSAVTPADPKEAKEADKADPGEVEKTKAQQRQTQTGKYGASKTKPFKPPKTKQEMAKKKSWIEIHMVDEAKEPVVGQPYRVTLADGETVSEGTLDDKGFARIEGLEPGTCKVTFPKLDKDAWVKL